MNKIDLRSDTLTQPTAEMLQIMITAPSGDDGRAKNTKGEDPSAVSAEKYAAELTGMEDALFVPSGTMGNTLAAITHCRRGSKIIVAENMHLYKAEKAIFDPDIGGMQAVLVPQKGGVYDTALLESKLKTGEISLVCLENSYNFEGGIAISSKDIDMLCELCHKYHVPVHLDGARLFNAAAALQVEACELCAKVDSVMFCVSKGLCAPIGSFIAAKAEWILAARQKRKLIGGQLRQVGILAAAGEYALRNLRQRLYEDHQNAAILASALADCPNIRVELDSVMTNIVMVYPQNGQTARQWIDNLANEQLVLAHYINDNAARFVTYHGITTDDIREAAARIRTYCANTI